MQWCLRWHCPAGCCKPWQGTASPIPSASSGIHVAPAVQSQPFAKCLDCSGFSKLVIHGQSHPKINTDTASRLMLTTLLSNVNTIENESTGS